MYTFSFPDFARRYTARLQAVYFFTSSEADTPRIPAGERTGILRTPWRDAVDAVAARLLAWTDPDAPFDKADADIRHLHLLPGTEARLPQDRIEACIMALVHETCHPDLAPHGQELLADLTADLI